MRPKSIARFEALSLLSVGLAAVAAVLSWGGALPGGARQGAVGSAMIAATGLALILSLVLILLTSRKGSNVAKWLFVVLVAVSAAVTVPRLGTIGAEGLVGTVDVASVVLQLVAIYFLFTAEARAWFAGGGRTAAAETEPQP